jgi:hypothetical protein
VDHHCCDGDPYQGHRDQHLEPQPRALELLLELIEEILRQQADK